MKSNNPYDYGQIVKQNYYYSVEYGDVYSPTYNEIPTTYRRHISSNKKEARRLFNKEKKKLLEYLRRYEKDKNMLYCLLIWKSKLDDDGKDVDLSEDLVELNFFRYNDKIKKISNKDYIGFS